MAAKKKIDNESEVVSFKINLEYYKLLEKLSPQHEDSMGNPLTPSTYARQLVIEALKRIKSGIK